MGRPESDRSLVAHLASLLSAEEAQVRFLSRLDAELEDDAVRQAVGRHRLETHEHVDRVSQSLKSLENAEEVRRVRELEEIVGDYDDAARGRASALDLDAMQTLARVERLEIELYERALAHAADLDDDCRAGLEESLEDERRMLAEVERLEDSVRLR